MDKQEDIQTTETQTEVDQEPQLVELGTASEQTKGYPLGNNLDGGPGYQFG